MLSVCAPWASRTLNISTRSLGLRMLWLVSIALFSFPFYCLCTFSIVAEKLKREGRNEIFEQETMEELEDEEGNVYNRKTYEDLKKQGLI